MGFEEVYAIFGTIEKKHQKLCGEGKGGSKEAVALEGDIATLNRAIEILESECMEGGPKNAGKEIPLSEWARRNGVSPATARQKAGRGGFLTARKAGRDWLINENEPNIDGRRKTVRNRAYFKNLDVTKDYVVLNDLELIVPDGFKKELNSIELTHLLNDQLLQYGLQTGDYILGSLKIVPASKGRKPIEKNFQISKRLEEYLEKFNGM